MQITQDITIKGLTPGQIVRLAQFVEAMANGEGDWADPEVVAPVVMPPFNPSPAPVAEPSPAPVVTAPVVQTGPVAAPGVPAATPATIAERIEQVAAELDTRGVPYHPDHHSERGGTSDGKNKNGTWRRKRNGDKAAADAYEQRYLAPKRDAEAAATANPTLAPAAAPAGVPTVAPSPVNPVGATPDVAGQPDAAAMFGAPAIVQAAIVQPMPTAFPAPGSRPVTVVELEQLWSWLATARRVAQQHADYMLAAFGGAPIGGAVYRTDQDRLERAYAWLHQYWPIV